MLTFLEYINKKKFLDQIGPYVVYIVDPEKVRAISQSDDEFNDYATHLQLSDVPKNEIWLSQDVNSREQMFLIHTAINECEFKKQGKKDWYELAEKLEKAERQKIDGLKFNPEKYNKKPSKDVYYKHYCTINAEDKVEIWLVDGEECRDLMKIDFICGGNGNVYKWCPLQEIWVEKDQKQQEINTIILHEYVESTLMREKHMSYDKAHTIASKVDWHHRHNWDKGDVEQLTRKKALKMAKSFMK